MKIRVLGTVGIILSMTGWLISAPKPACRIVGPKTGVKLRARTTAATQVAYHGGPLIPNVQVTTIYWGAAWSSDPARALLDGFFDFIPSSSLVDQLAEYDTASIKIGRGSHVKSVVVSSNPPLTVDDSAIQAFVQGLIAAGTVPTTTANSLYFVFVPNGTTVTFQGSASCAQFCGYHNNFGNVFYAVMPYANCTGCDFAPTFIDSMTVISSHELGEAITDPTGAGWFDDVSGEEIGDFCESQTKIIGN